MLTKIQVIGGFCVSCFIVSDIHISATSYFFYSILYQCNDLSVLAPSAIHKMVRGTFCHQEPEYQQVPATH